MLGLMVTDADRGRRAASRYGDLARRIRLGEYSALELTRVSVSGSRVTAPGRKDVADELAAFANGRGGELVLGVDDTTRDVSGIPLDRLDAVEAWVREICNDLLSPQLDAASRKIELTDSGGHLVPVLLVEVERSLFVHTSPGGYFRRLGSSKRELAPDLLARLFQERSRSRMIRFDETAVPGTGPSDLDYALTRRFLREEAARDEGVSETAARKLRLVADDHDGAARITLAGVLLCTRTPQRWLSHAYVHAISYAGERTDVDYQTDARDIAGPLDEQVAEAMHFVRRNVLVRAVKSSARTDRQPFSNRAVFEALVNAVAHRDYSVAGTRIRLHLFGNRLELYVPGALANTLTPDSMHLRQASRNELIEVAPIPWTG